MVTKETFMKECVSWSNEEEMAAKELAQNLGHKIVIDCRNRQPSDIDLCIMERIAGLNYLKDIGNALPKWHKGKNQAYKLHQMTEEIIRAAMK